MFVRLALIALSSLGFIISLSFTLAKYRLVSPEMLFMPRFCRIEGGVCLAITGSPQASLFGLPNSVLGMVYYSFVIAFSLNLWPGVPREMVTALFITSLVASATGVYLAHSLIRDLKTRCSLCFVSHGINIFISILLAL